MVHAVTITMTVHMGLVVSKILQSNPADSWQVPALLNIRKLENF